MQPLQYSLQNKLRGFLIQKESCIIAITPKQAFCVHVLVNKCIDLTFLWEKIMTKKG